VDGIPALVLRLVLLLGVAELSYRYLEMPVRRGALARGWRRVRDGDLPQRSPALIASVVAVAFVVVFTGFRVITAPAPAAAAGTAAAVAPAAGGGYSSAPVQQSAPAQPAPAPAPAPVQSGSS
jgi:peptidoglycan/LPS O-acetylase OafA/YrhL